MVLIKQDLNEKIQKAEYIEGTQTASTNVWTGVSTTIGNLKKGQVIYYKLPYASTNANVTLNLTLKTGELTGAKNVYYEGTTFVKQQYPVNSVIGLVYDGSAWRVINRYTNTTYSTASTSSNGLMSSTDKTILNGSRAILNGATDNASSDEYKVTITGVTLTGGTLIAVLNNRGLSNNDGATLNVNNLGAKPIYYRNRPIKQGEFPYRSLGLFLYSGAWTAFNNGDGAWILIDEGDVYHKGIIDGGVNLLGQHTTSNSSGATGVINRTTALYHGEPVYQLDNTSLTDTTKYTDFKWIIGKNEFKYGDIFTLSFYAKGTSGKEIRTYFYGASGYINNRRLRSNSDVGDANIGGYGDGATRFTLTNDWKKYYVTYELNTTATTPTANKYVLIRVYGGTDIQLACAKLERGEIATDFTPSTTPINIDYTIDYNDYTTEGHYHIWGGSNASSQVNNTNRPPNDTQGGLLVVEKIPNGVVQKLYNYYLEDPKIYYRIYHYSAGWRDWKELTTEGHNHDSSYISKGTGTNFVLANGTTVAQTNYTNPSSHPTTFITNSETYSNLGSNLTNQKLINDAVNTKIGQKLTTAQGSGAANRFVYTDGSGNIGTKAQCGNLKIDGAIGTATGKVITTTTNGVLQASDTIGTANIADSSITSAKITDGTIVNGDIADSTITGGKIANNTIPTNKLQYYSSYGGGTNGTNGYVKMMTFKINGSYYDRALYFEVTQRHNTSPRRVSVRWKTGVFTDNDAPLLSVTYESGNFGTEQNKYPKIYLYKESTATWSLIVQKSEGHDTVTVRALNSENGFTITNVGTLLTTLPTSTTTNPLVEAVQIHPIHEFIVSNHSSGTNNWTGVSKRLYYLEEGTVVYFNLKQAPVNANATLNITFPDGTSSGAKTIYFNGSNLKQQYPNNSLIGMVFDGTNWIVISNYTNTTYTPASSVTKVISTDTDTLGVVGSNSAYARQDHQHYLKITYVDGVLNIGG